MTNVMIDGPEVQNRYPQFKYALSVTNSTFNDVIQKHNINPGIERKLRELFEYLELFHFPIEYIETYDDEVIFRIIHYSQNDTEYAITSVRALCVAQDPIEFLDIEEAFNWASKKNDISERTMLTYLIFHKNKIHKMLNKHFRQMIADRLRTFEFELPE